MTLPLASAVFSVSPAADEVPELYSTSMSYAVPGVPFMVTLASLPRETLPGEDVTTIEDADETGAVDSAGAAAEEAGAEEDDNCEESDFEGVLDAEEDSGTAADDEILELAEVETGFADDAPIIPPILQHTIEISR